MLERLKLIEALHAGAATPGERDAAAAARARVWARLEQMRKVEKAVEFRLKTTNPWSHRLLVALLRRYQLKPYRYRRQHRTTLMVRVPRTFMNEVLWPEYVAINRELCGYLEEVAVRVIAGAIEPDISEVEELEQEPSALSDGSIGVSLDG